MTEFDNNINAKINCDYELLLIRASYSGQTKNVAMLLEMGVDVNAKDKYGDTALLEASKEGHGEIVAMLLKRPFIYMNTKGRCNRTALMLASYYGHTEIVAMLLKKGVDVNAKSTCDRSALIWASIKGHKEIVTMLLEAGADVEYNKTLFYACQEGNTEIVTMLLNAGAHVNCPQNTPKESGITALMVACIKGNINIVNLLLEKGADVKAKTYMSHNSLFYATQNRHTKIMQILIAAGEAPGFIGNVTADIPILSNDDFEMCTSNTCPITLEPLIQIHTVLLPGPTRAAFNRSALQKYILQQYVCAIRATYSLFGIPIIVSKAKDNPSNPIDRSEEITGEWIKTNYPRGLNYDYSTMTL